MKIIKLDIDKKVISMQQANRIIKIKSMLGLDISNVIIKKSPNNNYHVIMEVNNNITDYGIVVIQSLMGSDIKREAYNLLRVASNKFASGEWNVLFEKKFKVKV